MLSINMSDVINVLVAIRPYLIAMGIIIVAAVAACIAVRGMDKPKRKLARGGALACMVLGLVICVNLILTGPMSTMISLVTSKGTIDEATSKEAQELAVKVAEEGIALLKNDEGLLPVASGSKLNVFGWASTSPILGGAGSGGLNESYARVSLLESLAKAGIQTNADLTKFYTDYKADRPEVGMWHQDWTLPEPNVSAYSADLIGGAKAFSDTALIVIGRSGGEGADLPNDMLAVIDGSYRDPGNTTYYDCVYDDTLNEGNDWNPGDHYLRLSNRERELVDLVCENFDKVIVLYNGANAFELGFVNDYPQIKALLWAAGQGHVGMTALGEILNGTVNPSARLVDTYVYDLRQTPWWNNFGNFKYTNMDEYLYQSKSFVGTDTTEVPTFVRYVEGIYVGYRFYETAAAEGLIDYDGVVQFPFGYGLSYTTFSQQMGAISESGGTISFDVTVTNTGSVAGKDVVEVYVNPPYTDGGIEKSVANLVQFGKTKLLRPGESDTVRVSFSVEDLASYDYKGARAYVLEAGDYEISINSDSHTKIASGVYSVPSSIVYGADNKRGSDKVAATNLFDYAAGDVAYLSRAGGFANYAEATAAPASYEMPADAKAAFLNNSNYLSAEAAARDEDPDAPAVTTGAKNGLKLADLRGLPKDDAKWDALLDQMTLDDMNAVISLGGYQTNSVESIGKVRTNDCDGPTSINNNFTGVGSVGFPVPTVVAATWNKELARAVGDSIGKMGNEMDVSGWYAPAVNNHRTAFAGRNFEYFSEDGVLAGYMAGEEIKGCQAHGVYAYMKHFAMNDQEGNRCSMLCTWSNEQAIREIYLRPFEICVKDADALAVMSSFNYIGNRWAGGTSALCNTVLRGEWGFRGFVETDYFGVYAYMNSDQAIRNGSDLMLVNYPTATNNVQFRESNGAKLAMRTAAKNILYVVANSRAYAPENLSTGMAGWKKAMYLCDALIVVVLALCCFMMARRQKQ